jgi:hypothetical protein
LSLISYIHMLHLPHSQWRSITCTEIVLCNLLHTQNTCVLYSSPPSYISSYSWRDNWDHTSSVCVLIRCVRNVQWVRGGYGDIFAIPSIYALHYMECTFIGSLSELFEDTFGMASGGRMTDEW